MEISTQAITSDFVNFIERNVKSYPGKSSLKFNIIEPRENLKFSLYSLEKGFTMNEEMVHWLEENKDVEVQVVTV